MNKEALIIFLKYPELGRSKTRLAKAIGDENALKIYISLLEHTYQITNSLKCDKFLFYDKVSENKMPWGDDIYQTAYQIDKNLGSRMQNAFEQIFNKGYKRIIIMGSDCIELSQEIIELGFNKLAENEVVIGPAKDGGYYMLGLRKMIPQLFNEIAWSTSQVYPTTIKTLKSLGIVYTTTPTLSDIDTIDDLTDDLKLLIN